MLLDALQIFSGPLIAAVAVIVTQVLANQREDRRVKAEHAAREADRMAEDGRRQEERQDNLNERWRDDRRAAYGHLASLAEQAAQLAERLIKDFNTDPPAEEQTTDLVDSDLPLVMAEVALIASDGAQECAADLQDSMRDLDLQAWVCAVVGRSQDDLDALDNLRQEVLRQRRGFLDMARQDLGTV